MKLSEASPPHPWNPELPRFSQAVDHLPAIWVCGINSGPVYPFPFRYLGARVTPSRSLQSSPCYHRQGLVALRAAGGGFLSPVLALHGRKWKAKKPLSLTPVEEPRLVSGATPFGVGIRLNGFLASASTPSLVRLCHEVSTAVNNHHGRIGTLDALFLKRATRQPTYCRFSAKKRYASTSVLNFQQNLQRRQRRQRNCHLYLL